MAATAIALKKMGSMNTFVDEEFAAITTSGCAIPIGKDERLLFVVRNTNAGQQSFTVTKGDGINAASANLVKTLAAGAITFIELDSSRYGQMNGENKGKFNITSTAGADVKLMAIQLV
jgi:hypothetical protein